MKRIFMLIILLLLTPICFAGTIRVNTTITLDYIGNDQMYLRTETGDHLLNASDQTDMTFNIEIVRESTDNLTDYERLVNYLLSVNQTCYSLVGDYNFSEKYVNCSNTLDKYRIEKNFCEIEKKDLENRTQSALIQTQTEIAKQEEIRAEIVLWQDKHTVCSDDLSSYIASNTVCQNSLQNVTKEYNEFKSSSDSGFTNGIFLGVVVTGIVALIIISKYAQKNRPKAIRDYGYADQM